MREELADANRQYAYGVPKICLISGDVMEVFGDVPVAALALESYCRKGLKP